MSLGLSSDRGRADRHGSCRLSPRPQVVRLSGADVYETAVLVARQVKVKLRYRVDRVVIVPSDSSGGVLAGSALAAANGWPILLTPVAGPFSQMSADAIAELGATSGICRGHRRLPTITGFTVEKALTGTVSSSDSDGRLSLCAKTAEYAAANGYLRYRPCGCRRRCTTVWAGRCSATYVSGAEGTCFSPTSGRLCPDELGVHEGARQRDLPSGCHRPGLVDRPSDQEPERPRDHLGQPQQRASGRRDNTWS